MSAENVVIYPETPKATKAPKAPKEPKAPKAKEEKPSCPICADHYTPVLRREITCKFCQTSTCRPCIERYLMTRYEDAHCIHCRVNYSLVSRELLRR